MKVVDWILGRRLSRLEQDEQKLGALAGVPVLGLDALSSAAYGPEAALTVLLPLGAAGIGWVTPITAIIVGILLVVFVSYRQTIAAYPGGGGSYTVASENLGQRAGLVAGAALALDYVLNVAVGVSAGVGALVSVVPSLLPHTLELCLGILGLLTLLNLRGLRESSIAFAIPTSAFIFTLGTVIVVGLVKTIVHGGHPIPIEALPVAAPASETFRAWILIRAFASGCTAMTGVEAVSNAVPIFKEPRVPLAQRTLTIIIFTLLVLLGGIAWLSHVYHVAATAPGQPGYQSVLSMITGAVIGRGILYKVTMASVVSVLALSANTSFADFPRLCHVLAHDGFLPGAFAVRGRRLVYTAGIALLAVASGGLLVAFGGITDRLIPLFAIGAFLAFTLSQAGMVQHWRKKGGPDARRSLIVNGVGAMGTGITLGVVCVSKFSEGAWITVICLPLLVYFFVRVRRHYDGVEKQIATSEPLIPPERADPIVVVPIKSWNQLSQHALGFALRISHDIHVVQIRVESDDEDLLTANWERLILEPARAMGLQAPKLVTLVSNFRRFFKPMVDFVQTLEARNPDRHVVVVIPDLVLPNWYESSLHNHRGTFLRTLLRIRCSSRLVIVSLPYHLKPALTT